MRAYKFQAHILLIEPPIHKNSVTLFFSSSPPTNESPTRGLVDYELTCVNVFFNYLEDAML